MPVGPNFVVRLILARQKQPFLPLETVSRAARSFAKLHQAHRHGFWSISPKLLKLQR